MTHTPTKRIFLIFPHQIFQTCALLENEDAKHCTVYLLEDFLYFKQYNFHKQKIVLHRASMKFYVDFLESKGYSVTYVESHDLSKKTSLVNYFKDISIEHILYTDTVDNWLEKHIQELIKKKKASSTCYDSPAFLTSQSELDEYSSTTKRPYFMKNFYAWQRKRLGILVNTHGEPEGGKWSFDEDNRKKIPKDIEIPTEHHIAHNAYVTEALAYVEQYFPNNIGTAETFNYATTFTEAHKCVSVFLHKKLADFGPYEDAIDKRSHTLFHSVLSPYLNNGLVLPDELVSETLTYREKHARDIPLSSVEGFIRQVIGWREYMRYIYIREGTTIRNKNYFHAKKSLADSFWSGKTGLDPIDDTIQILLKYAYCHHIPRLMVLGNGMNLCGFVPNEVYQWFMEFFIDAYDWVMVPNVYSMALYADGGMITTKPYISSSNYILGMSDYTKSAPWTKEWDALYWNFIDTHFETLQKENRLGFVAMQYRKIDDEKMKTHRKTAHEAMKRLSSDKKYI